MYIFRKDYFDYLQLNIKYPIIWKYTLSDMMEEMDKYILKFDTTIQYIRSPTIKAFRLCIFGFGFEIIRQRGF